MESLYVRVSKISTLECERFKTLTKKRIARSGQGKRGGFRTLIATNKDDRWIFVFGFPKNERSNINQDEEEALKKLSSKLLSLTPKDFEKAKLENVIIEVNCNEEEEVRNS